MDILKFTPSHNNHLLANIKFVLKLTYFLYHYYVCKSVCVYSLWEEYRFLASFLLVPLVFKPAKRTHPPESDPSGGAQCMVQTPHSSEGILACVIPFLISVHCSLSDYISPPLPFPYSWGFPGALVLKNLPVMQEIQLPSLGQEDSLEKGMAIHFNILAWRIPWTEEPGRLQSTGSI